MAKLKEQMSIRILSVTLDVFHVCVCVFLKIAIPSD